MFTAFTQDNGEMWLLLRLSAHSTRQGQSSKADWMREHVFGTARMFVAYINAAD